MDDQINVQVLINFYFRRKNFDEGIALYNEYLKSDYNLKLKLGGYITDEMLVAKKYYKHLWKNEDLTNKTLFVFHNFAGMGDNIMFARYIPNIIKQAGKIIFELRTKLIDLYKFNFPECEFIEKQTE